MYDSYGQYATEIIDILTRYFKCSIDTYRYLEENQYEKIVISMLEWNNYKMVVDLKEEYDKAMNRNYGKITQFDIDNISRDIIYNIEQGYLNTIRRGF